MTEEFKLTGSGSKSNGNSGKFSRIAENEEHRILTSQAPF